MPDEASAAAAGKSAAGGARERLRAAFDVLAAVAIGSICLGAIYFLSSRDPGREPAAAPAGAPAAAGKRLAQELCEEAIRGQVRAPLRVIGFRSALVAEQAGGGFGVSGTVELQSVVGEVQLRRYSCGLRPGGGAGLVLEVGRLL